MNKLLELSIELYVDRRGNLRVSTKGDIGDIYIVIGFKMKTYTDRKFIFPILRVEIPKK